MTDARPATLFSHSGSECPKCASKDVRKIGDGMLMPDGRYQLHECKKCGVRFETRTAKPLGVWS